ncbi:hydantoinase/oxoprolinase family protein [Sphingomonas crocodyli]|uniref:Hydantoinase/oxoprolinase family protein n=1 Tax=Sphingomonas crocodyli TaxID=1979270 RepID=A0A437M5Q4_9SPHN|nr:hydantoinase/oxoprolinase family protein [Sphingomonas crocodyli]RVT92923.1 hydantoinase/oxoprolinase family protein [Sphingomonas crocodyli]
MGFRVGVDVGGSFTDFAILDESDQSVRTLKVLSRPDEPGAEVIKGLTTIEAEYGISPSDISYFTHGTTVGVNTVIQRNGIKLALFATRNFEDVLELARLKIPQIHNLLSKRPEPLISRDRVFSIDERMGPDGHPLLAVDRGSVEQALAAARAAGCEGAVVSLLHSYRNPAHEAEVKAIAAELVPDFPIFPTAEIWPIIREYERTITATISGYVQPKVEHYLTRFEQALEGLGVVPKPRITRSNGGVMSVAQAKTQCVQMILSGTASGVIGASYLAKTCGFPAVMSFDVGGTSADVAVIVDGQPQYGVGELIGDFQIHVPTVSVSSIGQGGGSIAWLDELGILKVGPDSAGSRPGPACFGRGGERPTLTDAFAATGFVGHSDLGYNAISVDRSLAEKAIDTVARPLGLSVQEAAEQIIRVAVSGMYTDTSGLVSRFGVDPRDFYFLAFGGAGPMTACFLARELNMKGVIVPPTPGVLSALGGLIADLRSDFIKTLYEDLEAGIEDSLRAAYDDLRTRAIGWLRDDQGYEDAPVISCSADMRYRGQSFEIETPIEATWIEAGDLEAIASAFHDRHQQLFDHQDRTAPVQLISLKLVISGATPKPTFPEQEKRTGQAPVARHVPVFLGGSEVQVPLYNRTDLFYGAAFTGPAIVAQADCTTCIPGGFDIEVDRFGNLIIASKS